MPGQLHQIQSMVVLELSRTGGPVLTDRDAMDLVALGLEARAEWVAISPDRLGPAFFDLSTRIAGEVIQKFVNYRIGLAVVGDISAHVAKSTALRDFVYESNRGRHVWFVADFAELGARLV